MGLLNLYKSVLSRSDKIVKKIIDEIDKSSKKVTLNDIVKTATDSKKIIKNLKNASDKASGTGITLTNNEIKDVMKVIKSLENRGLLLKGTARKLVVKNEDFSIFLGL